RGFFFFQAEDGIRAFHVTGVQTCALPIFAVLANPLAADPAVIIGENSKAFEKGLTIISRLTNGKVFVTGKPGANVAVPKADNIEIGRASCRERVYIAVVDVTRREEQMAAH